MKNLFKKHWLIFLLLILTLVFFFTGTIRWPQLIDSTKSDSYFYGFFPSHYFYLIGGNVLADNSKHFFSFDEIEVLSPDILISEGTVFYEGSPQSHIDFDSFRVEDGRFFDAAGEYRPTRGNLKLKD